MDLKGLLLRQRRGRKGKESGEERRGA